MKEGPVTVGFPDSFDSSSSRRGFTFPTNLGFGVFFKSSSQMPSVNQQCWEISPIPCSLCFCSNSHLLPCRAVIFMWMCHGAMSANSLALQSWISYWQVCCFCCWCNFLVEEDGGRLSVLLPRFFQWNATWRELPVFTEDSSLNLCRKISVVTAGYCVYFAYHRKWTSDVSYSLLKDVLCPQWKIIKSFTNGKITELSMTDTSTAYLKRHARKFFQVYT